MYPTKWNCVECGRVMAKTWAKMRNLKKEANTGERVFEICGKCFDKMVQLR